MVASFRSPGVLVREQVRGAVPANIATHSDIYLFGSASDPESLEPQPLGSLERFEELYGFSNPNRVYVRAIYGNYPQAPVTFIPVKAYKRDQGIVADPDPEAPITYSVQFESTEQSVNVTVEYEQLASDDRNDVLTKLIDKIQNDPDVGLVAKVTLSNTQQFGFNVIHLTDDLTITGSSVTFTTISNGLETILEDYIDAIADTLTVENDYPSGFIICPEAYTKFESSQDRALFISSVNAVAEASNCVSIVDCPGSFGTINSLLNERKAHGSPKGHSSYFAPWVTVSDGLGFVDIPPSSVVAATWSKYIRNFGLNKSPLGTQSSLVIAGVRNNFTQADSDFVNLDGVNLIRKISRSGYVIWGGRTMSSDPRYNFCSGRVIMNSINRTAMEAYLPFVGLTINVQGGFFHDLRNTGDGILFRYWNNGDLYGNDPSEAYLVVCDNSNNLPADLDQGIVKVDLYAVTSPTAERVLVTSVKVPIQQLANIG